MLPRQMRREVTGATALKNSNSVASVMSGLK